MTVPLRLTMFHVYFLKAACQGSVSQRCRNYDASFFQPLKDDVSVHTGETIELNDTEEEVVGTSGDDNSQSVQEQGAGNADHDNTSKAHPVEPNKGQVQKPELLSFEHFRDQVNIIHTISTWQKFFNFVGLVGPKSRKDMAALLRMHVKNSRRRKYHQAGMDFSRIHASGTSKILAKGQQYSASTDLKRVVFEDHWTFEGGTKYLDATCLLYANNKLEHTVDFCRMHGCGDSVLHSGDVMEDQSGTHTINIDLETLPAMITTCVFVVSAWSSARLKDIKSASVAFRNALADPSEDPLCVYPLDSHDKISHLKSVIMCKLYCKRGGGWHIMAIGDSNRGSASNYQPIYEAVQKLL